MAKIRVVMDWDAIKADPVEFARKLLKTPDGEPLCPFDAQAAILRGIKRRTVINTGRQFGKTTTMGILATHKAITNSNWNICIVAPSLEQSRIMFQEIEGYFLNTELRHMLAVRPKSHPFPVIKLKNGTEITARGANSPQFIRGNRFHLVIGDEAAFMRDTAITDSIEPTMTVTGKAPGAALVLISTPWGSGPFREWFMEAQKADHDPDLASFHFTSYDNPFADRKFLDSVKARYGENSLLWRTEYLGIFPDDDLSVFPWSDICWAMDAWPTVHETWIDGKELKKPAPFPVKPIEKHKYVQGADLANMSDFFVATVGDITDLSAIPLARMDRYQKKGYTAVKRTIKDNYMAYGHPRTLIDATTLAESVVEDLVNMGVTKAEGYKFGGTAAKWEVVQELARALSEHRLILPPDPDIRDELRFFEYRITEAKRVKMEASRGHDDIVMSLGLMVHLANQPRRAGFFASVDISRIGGRKAKPKTQRLPVNKHGQVDLIFGEVPSEPDRVGR